MAKKLLLVEYEPRYIDKVRSCAGADFDVTVARDGDEAIGIFSDIRPDIVLLSAVLPKSRANDVIREIRRKGGALAPPILLMMSGYKGSNPKADAQKIGAFDILEKPFSEDTFRSLVFDALDSTDHGSETIRISASQTQGKLTASDIFADVLEDLSPERERPTPVTDPVRRPLRGTDDLDSVMSSVTPAPFSAPPSRPTGPAVPVDKRLEETLSGMMPGKRPAIPSAPAVPPKPASPPASTPIAPQRSPELSRPTAPPKASPRPSTELDVESMLTQTLSGMSGLDIASAKPRPAPVPPPAPRPAAPPPPLPPPAPAKVADRSDQDRFGQYQLIEKIATGGMAEVFKARMSGVDGFQKIVAIKKILPHMAASEDFISMFSDEAKLAAQLNHPNIIHIYDLGKADKSYYIAMEYVEGRDLRTILKSGHELGLPLPPELALFVASKLAAALDYAHRRKDFDGNDLSLVHRDVSPQNVLISYEGDIKLCDFGIAKAATKSSQTQAGALKGKLQYMSPEQAAGRAIDRRSDLFSLGSVLYEMLTGEKLFKGDSDLTILDQVRSARIDPPSSKNPDIPKRVDSIVLKALARSLDDRYQNAADFQRDLESVLYTFSPAPGSADLAIYLHHLQAEENSSASSSDQAFESAFTATSAPRASAARPKKAKGTVVQRKTTGAVPKVAPPPPEPSVPPASEPAKVDTKTGVFGAYSSKRIAQEKKGRTPIIVAIGAAAAILIAGITWWARRSPNPRAPAPKPVVSTAAVPATTSAPAVSSASSSTFTEKSVEEEVKRQLAQKQKDLEKAATKNGKAAVPVPATASSPATSAARPPILPKPVPVQVAEPSFEAAPINIAPKRIDSAPAAPRPAPAAATAVVRGDLVGPGSDVIEPGMISKLNVVYPLATRREAVAGTVTILALVDEEGRVQSAKIQSGVASTRGINEAVLEAVKKARFRPATKNGVPVKMYKAITVEVQH